MSDNHDLADEANRLLQGTPLFDELSVEARARLASSATETAVLPGELVLQEGERGEEFSPHSVRFCARGWTRLRWHPPDHGAADARSGFRGTGTTAERLACSQRQHTRCRKCRLLRFPRQALLEAQGADETIGAKLTLRGETQAAERRTLLREKLLHDIGLALITGSITLTRAT